MHICINNYTAKKRANKNYWQLFSPGKGLKMFIVLLFQLLCDTKVFQNLYFKFKGDICIKISMQPGMIVHTILAPRRL